MSSEEVPYDLTQDAVQPYLLSKDSTKLLRLSRSKIRSLKTFGSTPRNGIHPRATITDDNTREYSAEEPLSKIFAAPGEFDHRSTSSKTAVAVLGR